MKHVLALIVGLAPLAAAAQSPGSPAPRAADAPQAEDAQLAGLIREALDRNPDMARSRTMVEAEKERIPQAKALPDPTVTLGLQNDGFKQIQVGRMETSYYQVMATQGLPWPGKRGLRGEIASLGMDSVHAGLGRTRLQIEADVKRAYYGLLLVRGQMRLLEEQAVFLKQAEDITRTRYEVGQGAQADLLRSQLERTRLEQTRLSLASQERTYLAALNKLRGLAPDAPVATTRSLVDVPLGQVPPADILARADRESPEIQAARIGIKQAEKSLDLARLERRPDFAVTAGLMPRGGLDPMWYAGVSVSVPIWSGQKQSRAVAEQERRRQAQGSELQSLQNLLAQRTQERAAQLDAVLGTIRIYKEGLLVQSESSFQAALAQYQVGRTPFLSVLEALNGWTADRGGLLQALAQAQSLRIAQEEFNLGEAQPIGASALGSASMGMGGSPSGAAGPARSESSANPQGGQAGPSMNAM